MRELPQPINNYYEDFFELLFKFANTFTEESVRHGFAEQNKKESADLSDEELKELGYTEEDLFNMKG